MSVCVEPGPQVAACASAAPVTGWRRMISDSLLVSAATIACQALGVITSLALRFALDPAQMGVWQALKLILGYANYANLGISKGAARELTIALGRGEAESAKQGLNLAFTVNTLSSLAYGGVLVGAACWIGVSTGGPWQNAWQAGLLALAALVVVQRHVTFHVTILRCRQAFVLTSQLALLEAALTLGVGAAAAWLWGLNGLYLGTLAVLLASWSFLQGQGAEPFYWAWDRREIARLIGIGAPVLLAGAATGLFQSIDKLMILACSSDREYDLGCYSLSLLVSGQLFGLANMLSIVMGPRYGELYGNSGDREQVALLAARASELQACVLALLGGLAMAVAAPILSRLFPDYQPGLAPTLWLTPGAIALGLSLPASQCLVAVYRERWTLWAVLAGLAIATAGNYCALAAGHGLVGVAIATSASNAVYLAIVSGVAIWLPISPRARLRYLAALVVTLTPVLGVAGALEFLWPGEQCRLATTIAKAAIVVAAWAMVAWNGWTRGGWQTIWREERRR